MEDIAMMRKQYVSPMMETFNFDTRQRLLFGSTVDSITSDGLFDEEGQDVSIDDTPTDIWKESY